MPKTEGDETNGGRSSVIHTPTRTHTHTDIHKHVVHRKVCAQMRRHKHAETHTYAHPDTQRLEVATRPGQMRSVARRSWDPEQDTCPEGTRLQAAAPARPGSWTRLVSVPTAAQTCQRPWIPGLPCCPKDMLAALMLCSHISWEKLRQMVAKGATGRTHHTFIQKAP